MRGTLRTAVLVAFAALAVAAVARADDPTRESYAAQVEPICQANADANKAILKGVRDRVKQDKFGAAGKQFSRAATEFKATIDQIAAVPQPPADEARLSRWIGILEKIDAYLRENQPGAEAEGPIPGAGLRDPDRRHRQLGQQRRQPLPLPLLPRHPLPVLRELIVGGGAGRQRRGRPAREHAAHQARREDAQRRRRARRDAGRSARPCRRGRRRRSPRRPAPAWRRSSGSAPSRAARSPGSPRSR